MNMKTVAILAACALFTGGCGQSPTTTSSNGQPSPAIQPPPVIQAEPFHGQVYKTLNGRIVLTLISKDECELTEHGTTYLCKYTKQTGALRVIVTALGTSQVVYLRYTDQGLQDNDGDVLLSPDKYEAALLHLQQEQQRQQQAQAEEKRKADEYQQHLQAIVASESSSGWYYKDLELDERPEDMQGVTGYLQYPLTKSPTTLSLYDTRLELYIITYPNSPAGGGPTRGTSYVFFHQIRRIGDLGEGTQSDSFFIDGDGEGSHGASRFPPHLILHFKSQADAQGVHDKLVKAFEMWKQKYPDAILR
jgi:hypothetical protein